MLPRLRLVTVHPSAGDDRSFLVSHCVGYQSVSAEREYKQRAGTADLNPTTSTSVLNPLARDMAPPVRWIRRLRCVADRTGNARATTFAPPIQPMALGRCRMLLADPSRVGA